MLWHVSGGLGGYSCVGLFPSLLCPWSVCLLLELVSDLLFLSLCLCSVVWGQVLCGLHHCSFAPGLLFCTFISGMVLKWKASGGPGHQQPCLSDISQDFQSVGLLQLVLALLLCLSFWSWCGLGYCSLESCGPGPGCLFLVCFLAFPCVKVSLLGIVGSPNSSCVCWSVWRELMFCFCVCLDFVFIF